MKNILDYLERTTVCNAWKTAVDDGNICMTWLELQEMSKSIGTALCKRTGRQKPVVILAEKSAVTLVAMFGVVYAGCFYVMVDPKQPIERLCEIFHTLLPEIIIIPAENEALLEQTGYGECKCLLKDIMKEQIDERQLLAVRKACTADDLLYGIFTSGSTGVPKGIVVSHKSVINFITHFIHTFQFAETDVIGNQAPFDFDVSVKDIYTCLMTGATLVIIPTKLFSVPPVLLDYLCNKHVNTLIWAVSALTLISALHGLKYRIPIEVKRVMFSGEVMPVKQLRQWQLALPEAEFVNLYGPSEITCNCTYYRVKRIFEDDEILLLCGQHHLAAPEHTAAPHDQKQIIIRAGIKFPDGTLLKKITLGCIIHQKVLHETVMCNRLLYTTEKYNCYNCIIHQFAIVFNHFLDMY